ncbi:MAG: secondary thiamine-phosphate synthase enzyme YjbQ [Candidatus Bathyarchaeia archaeon]
MKTSERRQLIDITDTVIDFVERAGVASGICLVSAPHATAAIIANENENGLVRDILSKLGDLFPQSGAYAHNAIDDNADAHLASAFIGHSRTFPIARGQLVRGTWQNIFLVELDGPRSRREVDLQIVGE